MAEKNKPQAERAYLSLSYNKGLYQEFMLGYLTAPTAVQTKGNYIQTSIRISTLQGNPGCQALTEKGKWKTLVNHSFTKSPVDLALPTRENDLVLKQSQGQTFTES